VDVPAIRLGRVKNVIRLILVLFRTIVLLADKLEEIVERVEYVALWQPLMDLLDLTIMNASVWMVCATIRTTILKNRANAVMTRAM
jgi:hypothetical protein